MKMEIPPIDMKAQKVTKIRACSLELKQNYFTYKVDFDAETPKDPDDEMLGWEEETTTFTVNIRRTEISAIEKTLTEYGQWCIYIGVAGTDGDLKLFFENKGEQKADAIMAILVAWAFDDLSPKEG